MLVIQLIWGDSLVGPKPKLLNMQPRLLVLRPDPIFFPCETFEAILQLEGRWPELEEESDWLSVELNKPNKR